MLLSHNTHLSKVIYKKITQKASAWMDQLMDMLWSKETTQGLPYEH